MEKFAIEVLAEFAPPRYGNSATWPNPFQTTSLLLRYLPLLRLHLLYTSTIVLIPSRFDRLQTDFYFDAVVIAAGDRNERGGKLGDAPRAGIEGVFPRFLFLLRLRLLLLPFRMDPRLPR